MVKGQELAALKDIHLPDPIQMGMLAPAWTSVLFFILLTILGLIYLVGKKRAQALPKKQALLLLQGYAEQYQKEGDAPWTSAKISELLKRVALVYYPRDRVAGLCGQAWIDFLNQHTKEGDFTPLLSLLLDTPFKARESVDLAPLIKEARLWIEQREKSCLP